jgi:acetyl-CoA carboxylase biotin carboxyl carrier protein
MQVDDTKRLVEIFQESDIDELKIDWGEGKTIRMTRRLDANGTVAVAAPVMAAAAPVAPAPAVAAAAPVPAPPAEAPDAGLVEIRSPMVGTFYRAPSPESPSYAEVGNRVEKGQVVCIVEAMKLMNEIESEVSGTIVRLGVDNASPVEFNQTLFYVKPD